MKIDCVGCLHGDYPKLEGGDLLIVTGDLTASDNVIQYGHFGIWLNRQKYRKKILIAGNHDGYFERKGFEFIKQIYEMVDIEYLCDSGTEFEGLKIWGSPWTPTFCNWHFMLPRGPELKAKWDLMPDDTDILITHGPAFGILDEVNMSSKANIGKHAGCVDLRNALERVKPKLHVFSHIHEQGGKKLLLKHLGVDTLCVNCSIMNEDYDPLNKPVTVNIGGKFKHVN